MRPDMHKVIVERPRRGHAARSRKTALRLSPGESLRAASEGDDYDSGPRRAPSHRHDKELNEHLQPLIRYLHGQAGRPWNKVYSEIREVIDSRSTIRQHILDHVRWEVETEVEMHGSLPYLPSGQRIYGLYIHPKSGLLRKTKDRRQWGNRKTKIRMVWVSDSLHYIRKDERWYRVETRLPSQTEVEILNNHRHLARLGHLSPLVEIRRRQLNKQAARDLEAGLDGPIVKPERLVVRADQLAEAVADARRWCRSWLVVQLLRTDRS